MPQHSARPPTAPAQLRPAHESVEILGVQPLENLVEIEVLAPSGAAAEGDTVAVAPAAGGPIAPRIFKPAAEAAP